MEAQNVEKPSHPYEHCQGREGSEGFNEGWVPGSYPFYYEHGRRH